LSLLYDDTVIELQVADYQYPAETSNVVLTDYNTFYTAIDRYGLIKVNLTRGWDNSNTAVGISAPISNRLYTNNIELNSLDIAARIDSDGEVASDSQASVTTFVSVDEGFTWEPIAVGERVTLDDEDYRLRFRLDLAQNPGTTPVVDTYSLSFGSYTQAPTSATLTVSSSDTSIAPNESFDVTVIGADELGLPVASYDQSVTLSLIDATTSNETSGLSVSSASVSNGSAVLSAVTINKAGTFYIKADDGSQTDTSPLITVTSAPVVEEDPVPTLSFSADRYDITRGDSVTLSWSSSNLSSVSIDQGLGSQVLNGSAQVSPTGTTTYTITGTGDYGGLQSSLTINVSGPASSSDDSGNSDSTSSDTGSGSTSSGVVTLTPSGGTDGGTSQAGNGSDQVESRIQISSPTPRKQTVSPRDSVRIQWNVSGDPDRVYVDYLDTDVASSGSFDFIYTEPVTITITAYKDGEVIDTETFFVEGKAITEETGSVLSGLLTPLAATISGFTLAVPIFFFHLFHKKHKKKKEEDESLSPIQKLKIASTAAARKPAAPESSVSQSQVAHPSSVASNTDSTFANSTSSRMIGSLHRTSPLADRFMKTQKQLATDDKPKKFTRSGF